MKQWSLIQLADMGMSYEFLRQVRSGAQVVRFEGGPGPLVGVLGAIESFLRMAEHLGLEVTLRAAALLKHLTEDLKQYDAGEKIREAHVDRLAEALTKIQSVFYSEARGVSVYVPMERWIALRALFGGAEKLLAENVVEALPTTAADDITAAGQCMLFTLPTAAAFHIFRATESVTREFCRRAIGIEPSAKATFGTLVRKLEEHVSAPAPRLVGSLRHIVENHRNPTIHPKAAAEQPATYTMDEAEMVFTLCRDVISLMVNDEGWQGGPAAPTA